MADSQKFIARNRAPRVQIEYDVELYGAEKKVQLPFVMGVMSDLSGKSKEAQPSVADRKFLEIDADNFDERMKSMKPRVAFAVPNTLTGEGNLSVDITFEKMSDFSPAAIAAKVGPLQELLKARTQLANLTAYMDGKTGAEDLLQQVLEDPALQRALSAGAAASAADQAAVLDALRGTVSDDEPGPDTTEATLAAMRDQAPADTAPTDTSAATLDALRSTAPQTAEPDDEQVDALAGLRNIAIADAVTPDEKDSTLDALRRDGNAADMDAGGGTDQEDALSALRDAVPQDSTPADDATTETLEALRNAGETVEDTVEDGGSAALDALKAAKQDEAPAETATADALASLRDTGEATPTTEDTATDDTLASLATAAPEDEVSVDDGSGVLDALRVETPDIADEDEATTDAALTGFLDATPDDADIEDNATDDALASLAAATPEDDTSADDGSAEVALDELRDASLALNDAPTDDGPGAALDALLTDAPTHDEGDDGQADAALDAIRESDVPEDEPDTTADDTLDALLTATPEEAPEVADDSSATLDALLDTAAEPVSETDTAGEALDGLLADAPEDDELQDTESEALDSLLTNAPDDDGTDDGQADAALDAIRDSDVAEDEPETTADATLDAILTEAPEDDPLDTTSETLDALLTNAPIDDETDDGPVDAALDAIRDTDVAEDEPDTSADDTLDALLTDAPEEALESGIESSAAIDTLLDDAPDVPADEEGAGEVLDDLRAAAEPEPGEVPGEDKTLDDLLDVEGIEPDAEETDTDPTLADLLADVPDQPDDMENVPDLAMASVQRDAESAAPQVDDGLSLLDDLLGDEDSETADTASRDLDALLDAPDAERDDIAVEDDTLISSSSQDPDTGVSPDAQTDDGGLSSDETDDLEALLAGDPEPEESVAADSRDDPTVLIEALDEDSSFKDDLDALLADPDAETDEAVTPGPDSDEEQSEDDEDEDDGLADLDALLAESQDDLDALLADLSADEDAEPVPLSDEDAALAALLAPNDEPEEADADAEPEPEPEAEEVDPLDALLAETEDIDLDALLGTDDATEAGEPDSPEEPPAEPEPEPEQIAPEHTQAALAAAASVESAAPPIKHPFGMLTAPRPIEPGARRKGFRIAVLGDFTGRANRGLMEPGDALSKRRAIPFDIDTVEDVIESFATTLVLPIGKDGTGMDVKLGGLDDLHPDELYDNVELFQELSGLRQRLNSGSMSAAAIAEMQGWGDEFGSLDLRPAARSAAASVPANLKLTDFQSLIGDKEGTLATPSPAADLIQRVVAPHVRAAPDPQQASMIAAVDDALSAAMRTILHHPDFQAVESTWRSLDLLARRVETGDGLEIVLYDVSAEELGADLAAHEDLSQSGFYRMVGERPFEEEGPGGLSAIFGLYTFEETPPHAELLARIAKVCAHIDAPFFTAISPAFLETRKEDRHPLVAKTWDTLRGLPEAGYVGLVSPRFMLRHPYGAKTDPIYPFAFEEFTMSGGLRSMLWANPAVLVAILLAETARIGGKDMSLGKITALDDVPFHFITDQHGDQVALPCTDRLLNTTTSAYVVSRGFMPVLSVKGRNEVRLGSWQGLGGGEIRGVWSSAAGSSAPPTPPQSDTAQPGPAESGEVQPSPDAGDDADLDALLAGFDDDTASDGDTDDIDADLAALLGDL